MPALSATSDSVPAISSEDPCGFYQLASSRRSSSPVHDPSIQIGWILCTVFLETLKSQASVFVGMPLIPPSGMPDSRWGFPSGPISDSMW